MTLSIKEARALLRQNRTPGQVDLRLQQFAAERPGLYRQAVRSAEGLGLSVAPEYPEPVRITGVKGKLQLRIRDPHPPFHKESEEASKTWKNYMEDFQTRVQHWPRPTTLNNLIAAVVKAGQTSTRIHAVGSGHSSSPVARPEPGQALIEIDLLNRVDPHPALRAGLNGDLYVRVEAGISIRALNIALKNRISASAPDGLGLANMGSFDGQTIIGAACTGTHGTGVTLPPICESIASFALVTLHADGSPRLLQVERSGGGSITDPARFDRIQNGLSPAVFDSAAPFPGAPAGLGWKLIQEDDDMFNALLVSLGWLGVVYAVTLKVEPAYWLEERRVCLPWREVQAGLAGRLAQVRHLDLIINPLPTWQPDGTFDHTCLLTTRALIDPQAEEPQWRNPAFTTFIEQTIGALNLQDVAACATDSFMRDPLDKTKPKAGLSYIIDSAIRNLQIEKFQSLAPNILILGAGNAMQAWSFEAAFPVSQAVAAVDRVLGLLQQHRDAGTFLSTAPFGVRFVAPTSALLAPQNRAEPSCMIEVPSLRSSHPEQRETLLTIAGALAGDPALSCRLHWGQLNRQTMAQLRQSHGARIDAFIRVFRALNPLGIFSNAMSRSCGFDDAAGTPAPPAVPTTGANT